MNTNTIALDALKDLYRGYVNTLNNGRDRILSLGGQCDPVDKMEASDPWLISARAAIAALEAEPQPIETAPKDGTPFLAWYPKHRLDEDDCPTGDPIGGAWAISSNKDGMWDEPDFLSAAGAWYLDDWCFAAEPTRWTHLPPDVDAALPTHPKD